VGDALVVISISFTFRVEGTTEEQCDFTATGSLCEYVRRFSVTLHCDLSDERSPLEELCDSVHSQWSKVWLMALERERKLREAKENIRRVSDVIRFFKISGRLRFVKLVAYNKYYGQSKRYN